MYAHGAKLYQFKAKESETKPYPLCLGNTLKIFTVIDMKNLYYIIFYAVDYNIIDVIYTVDIHNYLSM